MARYCDVLLILDKAQTAALFDLASADKHDRLTVYLTDLASLRSMPISLALVLWRIFQFRPDYAHFQEVPDRMAPVLAFILKRFCTIIWTVHDPSPHSGRDARLPRDKLVLRDC